jgi:hypothetical protein
MVRGYVCRGGHRLEARSDERLLNPFGVRNKQIDVDERSQRGVGVTGSDFEPLEEDEWTVAGLADTLEDNGSGHDTQGSESLFTQHVLGHGSAERTQAARCKEMQSMRSQPHRGRSPVDEPVYALPESRGSRFARSHGNQPGSVRPRW